MNTILVIVIGIVLGLTIYFFNPLGVVTAMKPLISTAIEQVSANPTAILTGAIPAVCAVGGVAWKAISSIKNRAKTEVNQIAMNANSQVQDAQNQVLQLQTEKSELAAKVEAYENMPNDTAALQQTLLSKEEKFKNQIQALETQHTNFVNQLTHGAKEVIDPATNQVYKLITLEKTVLK